MIGSGFSGFLLNEPATLLLNQLLFGPGGPWFAKKQDIFTLWSDY